MRIAALLCFIALGLAGCAVDARSVELRLALRVGDAAACAGARPLGTTAVAATLTEARLYLTAPALITLDGGLAPVTLTDADAVASDVALVELAGGADGCADEVSLRGTVTADATTGIRFELGLPAGPDLTAALAAAPGLDAAAMRRADVPGWYHARLGVARADGSPYQLWLGASGCEQVSATAAACAVENRPTVVVFGDVDTERVTLDLATLWRDVDLAAAPAGSDASHGCHVTPGDPECPPVLARLGLDGAGRPNGAQDVFAMAAP